MRFPSFANQCGDPSEDPRCSLTTCTVQLASGPAKANKRESAVQSWGVWSDGKGKAGVKRAQDFSGERPRGILDRRQDGSRGPGRGGVQTHRAAEQKTDHCWQLTLTKKILLPHELSGPQRTRALPDFFCIQPLFPELEM